ncbi:MAG: hypothetical protein ACUVRL_07545 [Candidatus Saccharicenans sp.]|uniref:hypothetical protein n=1 Tax=Candidatus Saccharicenans sp. TaxID=2819258 RepID=UPI00404A7D47
MSQFNLTQLLGRYENLAILKYGGTLDFERLEKSMEPVRLGQEEFSYRHLQMLQQDNLFPAWWKLPELQPPELEALKWVFKNPQPRDQNLVQKLFDIFKNIEILSCLLRVTCPQHYGIYSAPVENLLSIKAETPVKKYLTYLENLAELHEEYSLERIADVDMALFALCCLLNEEFIRQNPDFHQIYLDYLKEPNPVKKISARNALRNIRQENIFYLDLAELFLETDPEIAGIMAGKELEGLVDNLWERERHKSGYKPYRPSSKPELLEELARRKAYTDQIKEELQQWWQIRNDCVHLNLAEASQPQLQELRTRVSQMIAGLRQLKEKLDC